MKRHCGDCQLCCKLLPIPEFKKPAGERCQHQRHSIGCNIYPRRPHACMVWNCRWLGGADTGSRPDRAHYVVDIMPDFITATDEHGTRNQVPVIQVWIDPAYPEAHRDPRLRAWIERENMPALIRFNAVDAIMIAPPSWSADRKWFETKPKCHETTHSFADIEAALGPMKVVVTP
jgi:hypothetical protein